MVSQNFAETADDIFLGCLSHLVNVSVEMDVTCTFFVAIRNFK